MDIFETFRSWLNSSSTSGAAEPASKLDVREKEVGN